MLYQPKADIAIGPTIESPEFVLTAAALTGKAAEVGAATLSETEVDQRPLGRAQTKAQHNFISRCRQLVTDQLRALHQVGKKPVNQQPPNPPPLTFYRAGNQAVVHWIINGQVK